MRRPLRGANRHLLLSRQQVWRTNPLILLGCTAGAWDLGSLWEAREAISGVFQAPAWWAASLSGSRLSGTWIGR